MAGVQPAGQGILPPEMKAKWDRIIRTTPSRVVSAIEAYRPGMKTKFGDGHKVSDDQSQYWSVSDLDSSTNKPLNDRTFYPYSPFWSSLGLIQTGILGDVS